MHPTPTLYGHRGAPIELPENTLASFERALELGADVLETDLHGTADGHLVLAHDPTGARTANVPAAIRELPLSEIAGWDVGWGFLAPDGSRPFAGAGYRIPRLEEALEAFPDTPLNIDIKDPRPAVIAELVRVLRRRGAEGRVRLASFSARAIARARAHGYAGPTSLARVEVALFLATPAGAFRALPCAGSAAQIPTRVGAFVLAKERVIQKAHRAGLRVDFWTVNDPELASSLLSSGADGLITDDPRRLYPVIASHRAGSRARRA